jgi:hypothetical protein
MKLAELYASIPYESLNEQDIKMFYSLGIFNGFGWGGQNPIIKFFIERICSKFNIAIANFHDYSFWLWGDIARFHECNLWFYRAMKEDAMSVPWISRFYYCIISFLAYNAIELFGKKYFNFH